MTEQEKIKALLQMGVGRTSLGNYEESKIISKALEKQIPKVPIIVHPLQENDCGEFACPICKTGALVKKIDKFCWECGQSIKWE